jgi:hypothetical protein
MKSHHKHLYWLLALLAAFSFDQLFWGKPPGINFFIFVCLALLGGLIPIWMDRIPIPWQSYLLLIPILFFSGAIAWRAEPFTTVSNSLITLGCMAIFAATLLNGAWMRYRLREHVIQALKLALNSIAGGILFFIKVKPHDVEPQDRPSSGEESNSDSDQLKETSPEKPKHNGLKKAAPFLRGVLLALPILAVLAGLLASADPVFSKRLLGLFTWFDIKNLDQYIFRAFYILVIGYLLLSAFFHALIESRKSPEEEDKPLFKPFLGAIEANIVLAGVNILFLLFVIVQFTYLFGGHTNISQEGFTYSEYARRGFFELLAVAILSLLLFYSLSTVTNRDTKKKRWIFSILGLLLVGQLAIILTSAYTRLSLYEAAYGFTRLRTVTHTFILWTGLLLAATAVLEVLNRLQRLSLVLIFFVFGYGLTLNFMNVDGFIVEKNIDRAIQNFREEENAKLDTGYLYSLSYDSIPPLVAYFYDPATPEALRYQIGGVLACRVASLDLERNEPLTSYHFARARAISLLTHELYDLSGYEVVQEYYDYYIIEGDEMIPCSQQRGY